MKTLTLIVSLTIYCSFFSQTKNKLALLVAVTQYDRQLSNSDCRWKDLSTKEDIELMKQALLSSGFDSSQIIILAGKITKDQIIQAFKTQLIANAQPNGIYYFHFSGHGYQIPDDNNDEMDGFDEAIVPADACNDGGRRKNGFDYSKYLRDDELQVLLNELRTKVGAQGNVMVSLDACHSGTATRGSGEFRGQVREPDADAPNISGSSNADFGIVTEDKNLSPLTCFFASSEFELNKEYHSSTLNCGSLSYALSKAITESNTKTTYAALFDRVKNIMNSIVPGQTPHIEGEYNQEVFGGNIQEQAKYLKISKIESSKIVKIDGGLLSSFTENSIVGFYPPDTRDYRTATPYIKGKIISSEVTNSTVQLDSDFTDLEKLNLSWVYMLEKGITSNGIMIQVLSSNDNIGKSFKKKIESYPSYKITTDPTKTDILVELATFKGKKSDSLYVSNREGLICTKKRISNVKELNDEEFNQILKSIISYEQVKMMRSLEIENSEYNMTIEIIPYKLKEGVPLSKKNKPEEDFIKLDSSYIYKKGSTIPEIPVGTFVKFKVKNNGSFSLYYTILDISPLNEMVVLAPTQKKSPQEFKVAPGKEQIIPGIYKLSEPLGDEMLKIIMTSQAIDLRTVMSAEGAGTRGSSSPFEDLLNSSFRSNENTRGVQQEALETEDIGVKSFLFKIIGKVN